MKHKVTVDLPKSTLEIEVDDSIAPKTVRSILSNLPITVKIHVWGEELYTDPTPIVSDAENSRDLVNLMDVAYWLPGKAICLFFGPTPIGKKGEIKPYSAVNVIGKIVKGKFSKDGTVQAQPLGSLDKSFYVSLYNNWRCGALKPN